ncbi:MAG: hypothetical protein JF627_02330 [Alphaproteobacteria bacterium]|nr:hypothetical protein [Alphaproteobacteria bacterium]
MRSLLATLIFAATCLPAMAEPLPSQGSLAAVRGRAHVEQRANGTYIQIGTNSPRSVAGFIPFGDEPTFPDLSSIDGRRVQIAGVVVLDGQPTITMTDPDQLRVVR